MAEAPDAPKRRLHRDQSLQVLITAARLAELAIVILHDMLLRGGSSWPAI
jgi:hypothetical protein